MKVRAGQALVSSVDATAVIVTRAPDREVGLTCGGVDMVAPGAGGDAVADPEHMAGTILGKRYADPEGILEVLCTKGGGGSLALDGVFLVVQEAKPLPSSD